jgi:hypothetical protein
LSFLAQSLGASAAQLSRIAGDSLTLASNPEIPREHTSSLLRLSLDASTLMSALTYAREDIERALAFCAAQATEAPASYIPP